MTALHQSYQAALISLVVLAVNSLPAQTWVGDSATNGFLTLSADEVLIVEHLTPREVPACRIRWFRQPENRTVSTALAAAEGAYAFTGPGTIEFLDECLARLRWISADLATTVVLASGETASVAIAEGESVRFYRPTELPAGGRIEFRIYNPGADREDVYSMSRFYGVPLPGPLKLTLEAVETARPGGNDIASITYLVLPASQDVRTGQPILAEPAAVELVIQQSDNLDDWDEWLRATLPAVESLRFYRLQLEE